METSFIETHAFFRSLTPDHLNAVVAASSEISIATDEELFREGDSAEDFYLLKTGAVEVGRTSRGHWTDRRLLQPGDLIGWSWLVPPYQWSFSGRAVEDSILNRFDGLKLLMEFDDDPAFGYALLKRFAGLMGHRLAVIHDYGVGAERKPIEERLVAAIADASNAAHERKKNLAI